MKTETKGTGVCRSILDLFAALRAFGQVRSRVTPLLLFATVAFTGAGTLWGAGLNRHSGAWEVPVLSERCPGRTTRWAVVGGAEVPSFDSTFSSESLNPIIGTVWTHQRLEWWVDWSVQYQFNTGGGLDGDDRMRPDAAGSYPLYAGEREGFGPWGLYAIGEVK